MIDCCHSDTFTGSAAPPIDLVVVIKRCHALSPLYCSVILIFQGYKKNNLYDKIKSNLLVITPITFANCNCVIRR